MPTPHFSALTSGSSWLTSSLALNTFGGADTTGDDGVTAADTTDSAGDSQSASASDEDADASADATDTDGDDNDESGEGSGSASAGVSDDGGGCGCTTEPRRGGALAAFGFVALLVGRRRRKAG